MSGPRTFFDASVLIAGAWSEVAAHRAALAALDAGGWSHTHCLAEAFSQLTGKFRADPAAAAEVLRDVTAAVHWVSLSPEQVWQAVESARAAGVRGGGIYDWLHIQAARQAGCTRWATYNRRHFEPHAGNGESVFSP